MRGIRSCGSRRATASTRWRAGSRPAASGSRRADYLIVHGRGPGASPAARRWRAGSTTASPCPSSASASPRRRRSPSTTRDDRDELPGLRRPDARARGGSPIPGAAGRDARVSPARRSFTVAIDGPAASGKGTIGRAVAARFGFAHLDTGLLYRAVGVQALHDGRGVIDPHWAAELARRLSPEDLARPTCARRAPGRRRRRSRRCRRCGRRSSTSSARFAAARGRRGARRARHRHGDLPRGRGQALRHRLATRRARRGGRRSSGRRASSAVLADLRARDARDAARDVAPMVAAEDALLLDTTDLSIDAAVAEAVAYVRSRLAGEG